MKKIALLLIIFTCIFNHAYADGCFVPSNKDRNLSEPEQKAVIIWDGKKETMFLSSKVKADKVEDLMKIVWLVPVPSSIKPEVTAADMKLFQEIAAYFPVLHATAHDGDRMSAETVGASGARVIETKKVDIYDITILKTTSAQDLVDWLNSNGYPVPQDLTTLVEHYIKTYGDCYFVANKIDLKNKLGEGFDSDMATIDNTFLNQPKTQRELDASLYKSGSADLHGRLEYYILDHLRPEARQGHNNASDPTRAKNFVKLINYLAEDLVFCVLRGVSYEDSIANNSMVGMLNFIDKKHYEELIKRYAVGQDAIDKIALCDDHGIVQNAISVHWDYGLVQPQFRNIYKRNMVIKFFPMPENENPEHSAFSIARPDDQSYKFAYGTNFLLRLERKGIAFEDYKKFFQDNIFPIQENYKAIVNELNLAKAKDFHKIFETLDNLSQGVVTPIRIDFYPQKPIYPLKISSGNPGTTRIDVYYCGSESVDDANGILKFDETKIVRDYLNKYLKQYLGIVDIKFITRLVYEGDLLALNADAVFKVGKGVSDIGAASDEQAFKNIFISYSSQLIFEKQLSDFIENYPQSRFADDAFIYLANKSLDWSLQDTHKLHFPAVKADQLKALFELIKNNFFYIEDFSKRESFIVEGSQYYPKGYMAELSFSEFQGVDPISDAKKSQWFKEAALYSLVSRYREEGKIEERDNLIKTVPQLQKSQYADDLSCCDSLSEAVGIGRKLSQNKDYKGAISTVKDVMGKKSVRNCRGALMGAYLLLGEAYSELHNLAASRENYDKARDLENERIKQFTQELK